MRSLLLVKYYVEHIPGVSLAMDVSMSDGGGASSAIRERVIAASAAVLASAAEHEGTFKELASAASSQPVSTALMVIMAVGYTLVMVVLLSYTFSWVFWTLLSMLLTAMSLLYALYQLLRINLDLVAMSIMKACNFIYSLFAFKSRGSKRTRRPKIQRLNEAPSMSTKEGNEQHPEGGQDKMAIATRDRSSSAERRFVEQRAKRSHSSVEYNQMPARLAKAGDLKALALLEEAEAWRRDKRDLPAAPLLEKTTMKLRIARHGGRLHDLQFLLSGLLKRNHLGIHDEELFPSFMDMIESPLAQSQTTDADPGYLRRGPVTKLVVEEFQDEVEACLEALVDSEALSLDEKLAFFKKERRSLGQSALCLSGGGSICMYVALPLTSSTCTSVCPLYIILSGISQNSSYVLLLQSKVPPWDSEGPDTGWCIPELAGGVWHIWWQYYSSYGRIEDRKGTSGRSHCTLE